MSRYTLHRTQIIPGQLDSVFGFFEDPNNLALITPRWLNFRVVSATDDVVRQGTRIRYTISWFGLPMRWESLIERYNKGVEFTDRMLKGPYKSWHHTHQFKQVPEGVEISDRVEYELPLGWLGSIAHSLMVSRQLDAIFNYRTKRITQLLGTPKAGS